MNFFREMWELIVGQREEPEPQAANDAPAAETPPRCPVPLSSDNGTKADCKAKHHCSCE